MKTNRLSRLIPDLKFILRGLLAILALASLYPASAAQSACVCGYDDGRFTIVAPGQISINGSMEDWGFILGDPDNNSCDDQGTEPGSSDRDYQVQSTGRDLIQFAFTWDTTNVYTYTERAGSQNNTITFVYYADTDNDGMMKTGEPVILADWQGNQGSVGLTLYSYSAVDPNGDPMVDGAGIADGYDLPGGIMYERNLGNGTWATPGVGKMEWSVPWTVLGIPAGTAFSFHVSSANSTNIPHQIDDNMGGCGGRAATTQYADLTFVPDRSLQGIIGGTVYASHTLTNTGNGTDTFNLTSTISGSLSPALSYYSDQDGSGTFTAGDTLLTDTDGDGTPDTDTLAPGTSTALLIGYALTGSESGSASIVTTGTSAYDSNRSAAITDTLTVTRPILTIIKSASGATAQPGEVITYTVQVLNTGDGAATNVVLDDHMSPYTAWQLDYNNDGAPDEPFNLAQGTSGLTLGAPDYSRDDGSTWGAIPAPGGGGMPSGHDGSITNWRLPITGTMPAGGSFTLRYKVMVK